LLVEAIHPESLHIPELQGRTCAIPQTEKPFFVGFIGHFPVVDFQRKRRITRGISFEINVASPEVEADYFCIMK
jgi:hypothetical protein